VQLGRQDEAESSSRRRLHPFFRDVGITLLAQVAFAALSLITYRVLAQETGTDGFGAYSLVRQGVAFAFPIVTVGLIGGLPRYLALAGDAGRPGSEAYLLAAVTICGTAAAAVGGLALAFPEATAGLLFGRSARDDLVVPFVALLGATAAFQVSYGYFRGLLRVRSAALLQVGAFALPPPLIVLALSGEPIGTLLLLVAVALAAASLASIAAPLVRSLRSAHRARLRTSRHDLWHYGHRRVPGELAQLGLFVLVPVLAAHVGSLRDVAYLTAGQQVLSILSLAVLPLSLVLLPALTRLWASDREAASGYVGELAALAAHVAIFVSFQAIIYADIAIQVWLGPSFDDSASVVRVTVAPAALFVVYLMLRSTLDAVEIRSFNSRNNLVALGVLAIVFTALYGLDVARPVMCVAWAFAAGVTTQGVLTFLTVHRLFGLSTRPYRFELALPVGLATGLAGLAARPLVEGSAAELPLLLAVELVLAAVYFGALVRYRAGWVVLLTERLFERR
jgi:O-antigen/teichoic acid export membrane protein